MTPDKKYFEDRSEDLEKKINEKDKKDRMLSLCRLFLFVLATGFLIAGAVTKLKLIFLPLGGILAASFIFVVVIHNKVKKEAEHLKILKEVNDLYIARICGDFSVLTDSGEEFGDPKDDYSVDLDLFGERSLFSLYNISDTDDGRRAFAKDLANASFIEDTDERQKAVAEFLTKKEFLQEYQTVAREGDLRKPVNALKAISSDEGKFSDAHRILSYIMPFLWIVPLVMLITGSPFQAIVSVAVMIINIGVFIFLSSRYNIYFKAVDGIHRQTKAISALYELIEKEEFKSELIKDLVKGGASEGKKASEGLRSLSSACDLCKFRSQPFLALLLNSTIPFDLYCADKLLKWVKRYGKELKMSLSSLAKLESLMSCACVGLVSKESCFPTFADKAYFSGEEICHPLLDPETSVSNSITIDGKRVLVTGSNMSGKTTLIRTVGVCCILGYMGAPVPARSCRFGRMRVMSSMRIVDSIEENMSTFKAELVRISGIVKAAEEGDSLLFLIDEIFRGTNSTDRTDGALAVLRKLDNERIIGLMTTHDYALCDKVDGIINIDFCHFSETYDDEGISFDYKLHQGMCKNSNARYLMKLVGIE